MLQQNHDIQEDTFNSIGEVGTWCVAYNCEIASTCPYFSYYLLLRTSPSCFHACMHDRRRINRPAGGPCWSHNWHLMPAVRSFSTPPVPAPHLLRYCPTNCMVSSVVSPFDVRVRRPCVHGPCWLTCASSWLVGLTSSPAGVRGPPRNAPGRGRMPSMIHQLSAARSGSRHPEDGAGGLSWVLSLEYIEYLYFSLVWKRWMRPCGVEVSVSRSRLFWTGEKESSL